MGVAEIVFGAACGALSSAIVVYIRDRFSEASADAVLAHRVAQLEKSMHTMKKATIWMGDCIITVGASMKIELPDRPFFGDEK
jgi:hypothetical protein